VLAIPSVLNAIHDTPLTVRDALGPLLRPLVTAAFGAAALLFIEGWLPALRPVFALALRLPLFAALYALAWLLLPGGRKTLGEQAARLRVVLRSALRAKG
jgi:hypothetical protein